jgi:hypothetical protein
MKTVFLIDLDASTAVSTLMAELSAHAEHPAHVFYPEGYLAIANGVSEVFSAAPALMQHGCGTAKHPSVECVSKVEVLITSLAVSSVAILLHEPMLERLAARLQHLGATELKRKAGVLVLKVPTSVWTSA